MHMHPYALVHITMYSIASIMCPMHPFRTYAHISPAPHERPDILRMCCEQKYKARPGRTTPDLSYSNTSLRIHFVIAHQQPKSNTNKWRQKCNCCYLEARGVFLQYWFSVVARAGCTLCRQALWDPNVRDNTLMPQIAISTKNAYAQKLSTHAEAEHFHKSKSS